jgi:hypothetical protein
MFLTKREIKASRREQFKKKSNLIKKRKNVRTENNNESLRIFPRR